MQKAFPGLNEDYTEEFNEDFLVWAIVLDQIGKWLDRFWSSRYRDI